MNCSFFTCDRVTHLKIVAVAVIAGIIVMAVGIHARSNDTVGLNVVVVKAGKPAVYSTREDATIR